MDHVCVCERVGPHERLGQGRTGESENCKQSAPATPSSAMMRRPDLSPHPKRSSKWSRKLALLAPSSGGSCRRKNSASDCASVQPALCSTARALRRLAPCFTSHASSSLLAPALVGVAMAAALKLVSKCADAGSCFHRQVCSARQARPRRNPTNTLALSSYLDSKNDGALRIWHR